MRLPTHCFALLPLLESNVARLKILKIKLVWLPLALVAFALITPGGCFADQIYLGYIELSPGAGGLSGFDILDETGSNATVFPNALFPVTTPVSFSDVGLFVNFADGTADIFNPGSNYFSAEGVGEKEFDLATNPIASVFLIGTFGATALTLNNGSQATIDPDFLTFMMNSVGNLVNDQFAFIEASTVVTPEPGMGAMVSAGVGAIFLLRRRRLGKRNRAR
jgi:hypothetical protein